MIGSTPAPLSILDPYETTGDLRDEWELPEGDTILDERSALFLKCQAAGRSGGRQTALRGGGGHHVPLVTLPKLDNEGTRS